ncbi:MAG: hypothetical protein ACRCXB_23270 [Aeromonadaceae bacterium]
MFSAVIISWALIAAFWPTADVVVAGLTVLALVRLAAARPRIPYPKFTACVPICHVLMFGLYGSPLWLLAGALWVAAMYRCEWGEAA